MSDRKKPKKYSKMGYQQKQTYVKDQLKELGQEGVYHDNGGARGTASTGFFNLEKSEEALRSAANNDYDRREALKYGVNSGDKRFAGLDASSGFNSMEALVNTDRAINKYGYNELGHKNMSSDADFAAVSNSLFNKSRTNFGESLTDSMSAKEQQKEAESGAIAPVSERLQQDRDTVEEIDNKDYNVFNDNIDKGDNLTQRTEAADAFLGKYKLDLKKEKNFQPVLPTWSYITSVALQAQSSTGFFNVYC